MITRDMIINLLYEEGCDAIASILKSNAIIVFPCLRHATPRIMIFLNNDHISVTNDHFNAAKLFPFDNLRLKTFELADPDSLDQLILHIKNISNCCNK